MRQGNFASPHINHNHWCFRFMRRNRLVHGDARKDDTSCSSSGRPQREKVLAFQRFVIDRRQEHPIALSQIGNMDEVPLTFDMPTKRTVNAKGQHSHSRSHHGPREISLHGRPRVHGG
eukprot:scpid104076/ scgid20166/ 